MLQAKISFKGDTCDRQRFQSRGRGNYQGRRRRNGRGEALQGRGRDDHNSHHFYRGESYTQGRGLGGGVNHFQKDTNKANVEC